MEESGESRMPHFSKKPLETVFSTFVDSRFCSPHVARLALMTKTNQNSGSTKNPRAARSKAEGSHDFPPTISGPNLQVLGLRY